MNDSRGESGAVERFEEEVLVERLAEIGGRAGAAGGMLGGGAGGGAGGAVGGRFGGGRGGARGARRGARRMRSDRCEVSIELPVAPEEVRHSAAAALSEEGTLLEELPEGVGSEDEVWGLLGVGLGGLNPVVVRVAASPTAGGHSNAEIRTTAKEGLIKRRWAEKTAARIQDVLNNAAGVRAQAG